MKRSNINLAEISDLSNLIEAYWRASRGKRNRMEVRAFSKDLSRNLSTLGGELRGGDYRPGPMNRFTIHDPKKRLISAPCFRDRVAHHAIMNFAGPVLDRALADDSFACRKGKGSLKAVSRALHHCRRRPWYLQVDVKGFFDNIDHGVLFELLSDRFKNQGLLDLFFRIITSHRTAPDKGLPIGALTSQHFANFYLARVDRWLLSLPQVSGMVRYMDDIVCWTQTKKEVKEILALLGNFLMEKRGLSIKPGIINFSKNGLKFCGYKISPRGIRLTQRRKNQYKELWKAGERAFLKNWISESQLQCYYQSILAPTRHADSLAWRRKIHKHHGSANLVQSEIGKSPSGEVRNQLVPNQVFGTARISSVNDSGRCRDDWSDSAR